jgi:lipoprotein NlpI
MSLCLKSQADATAWPFPVVRYLKREITGDELLALGANNDQRTEAHGYIGMDLLLAGKRAEARAHFQWVTEYGNSNFHEYHMARAELIRMQTAAASQ